MSSLSVSQSPHEFARRASRTAMFLVTFGASLLGAGPRETLFAAPPAEGAPAGKKQAEADQARRQLEALKPLLARVDKLTAKGDFKQATTLAEVILATQEKLLGEESLTVARSYRALAGIHLKAGDTEKALSGYEKSLGLLDTLLGRNHPEVADARGKLANILLGRQEWQKALPHLEALLAFQTERLGPGHPDLAPTLEQMASVYRKTGQAGKAVELLERAIELKTNFLGAEDPGVASARYELGLARLATGKTEEAEKAFQTALKIFEKSGKKEGAEAAGCCYQLAAIASGRNQPAPALVLAKRALSVFRKLEPGPSLRLADSLHQVGVLLRLSGQKEEALPYLKSALDIRIKLLGKGHPKLAASYHELGKLYEGLGEPEKAQAQLEAAMGIRKAGPAGSANVLAMTDDLVRVYRESKAYEKAIPLAERALAEARQQFSNDSPELMKRIQTLGELYEAVGDYPKALPYYETSLNIYRMMHGDEHPQVAKQLNALAGLYFNIGNYQKALLLYGQVLEIRRNIYGSAHPDVGKALMKQARIYEATGHYEKAVPALKSALGILRRSLGEFHPELLDVLKRLGSAEEASGHLGKALLHFRDALEIQKKLYGREHRDIAETLSRMAGLYKEIDQTEKAGKLYEEALQMREHLLGKDSPEVAKSLNNLANLVQATGDPFRARALYESALKIFRNYLGKDHPDLTTIQNNLAILLGNLGDRLGASRLLEQSIGIEDDIRNNLLPILNKSQKQDFINSLASTADLYLSLMATSSVAIRGDDDRRSLEFVWTRKKLRAETAFPHPFEGAQTEEAGARRLLDDLQELRRKLATQLWARPKDATPDVLYKLRQDLRKKVVEREIDLTRQSVRYARKRKERNPLLVDVQARLPRNAALVEFAAVNWWDFDTGQFSGRHYLAIALYPHGTVRIHDLGETRAIVSRINQFRKKLKDSALSAGTVPASAGPNAEPWREAARDLHEKIIRPLRLHMEGVTELYLAPTGALHLLPFRALLSRSGRFLGDTYRVTCLLTGADLITAPAVLSESRPVIVAAPDFKQESSTVEEIPRNSFLKASDVPVLRVTVPSIPEEETEGRQLAQVLEASPVGAAELFFGQAAREGLTHSIKNPRYLHLGTYWADLAALAPKDRASFSGLSRWAILLSGAQNALKRATPAQEPGEDGVIRAAEIARAHLAGTEVVSLSSVLLEEVSRENGEACTLFLRAFQKAGTSYVLLPVWPVPEEPRRMFFWSFYETLSGEGGNPVLAFRKAREALQQYSPPMNVPPDGRDKKAKAAPHRAGPYDHPFYWAAFDLVQLRP